MTEFTPARLAELRAVAEAAALDFRWFDSVVIGDLLAGYTGRVEESDASEHVATFDPTTVLALIAALEAANESKPSNSFTSGSANERELADLRAELEAKTAEVDGLADDGGHKAAKYWKWWQREQARADLAEAAIERVRAARAGHPECDKYDDDSPVVCGWMRTVQSIDAALQAIEGAGQ